MRVLTIIVASLIAVSAAPALAQAPTATISGHVISADGQPLPGVTVSVASPNLQGIRTAVTTANGDYIIPLLPPGEYALSYEIGSFEPVKERRNVAGTQNAIVDVTMSVAGRAETVTVIGDAETFVQSAHVATNFRQNLMATLPRTFEASRSRCISRTRFRRRPFRLPGSRLNTAGSKEASATPSRNLAATASADRSGPRWRTTAGDRSRRLRARS
jgi:hypothetical protein